MCEIRDLERSEVVDSLSMVTDMSGGIHCPVPDCKSSTIFKRWGDMRAHFLDDTTHKKDYFKAFMETMKEPYCDSKGAGFNHGVNSLILALIRNPTSLTEIVSQAKAIQPEPTPTPPSRPKKARPIQEQQTLANMVQELKTASEVALEAIPAMVAKSTNKSAFSQISEKIRDSDEINKVWRGKIWDQYVDMFHGIPPCFHCRSEEGKQIHHQNPLFHEIILVSLNKLGTTAEMIMEQQEKGNELPFKQLLTEVFNFHMKEGKVCAVPYCAECNQDAETKRKKGKWGK